MCRKYGLWILFVMAAAAAYANHPCSSPLILDLEHEGVLTTSLAYPVEFDINSDGEMNRIGWTFGKVRKPSFGWI